MPVCSMCVWQMELLWWPREPLRVAHRASHIHKGAGVDVESFQTMPCILCSFSSLVISQTCDPCCGHKACRDGNNLQTVEWQLLKLSTTDLKIRVLVSKTLKSLEIQTGMQYWNNSSECECSLGVAVWDTRGWAKVFHCFTGLPRTYKMGHSGSAIVTFEYKKHSCWFTIMPCWTI